MYGSEIWKINKGADKAIDILHHKCLRRILKNNWEDYIILEKVLKRAKINGAIKQRS